MCLLISLRFFSRFSRKASLGWLECEHEMHKELNFVNDSSALLQFSTMEANYSSFKWSSAYMDADAFFATT